MPFWLKSSPCDIKLSKKEKNLNFPPAMASSSPVASEKGTIASFSLLGTDVADGEDDMLLDMPTTEAAPAACGPCPPQAPHLGELRWVPLACNTPSGT